MNARLFFAAFVAVSGISLDSASAQTPTPAPTPLPATIVAPVVTTSSTPVRGMTRTRGIASRRANRNTETLPTVIPASYTPATAAPAVVMPVVGTTGQTSIPTPMPMPATPAAVSPEQPTTTAPATTTPTVITTTTPATTMITAPIVETTPAMTSRVRNSGRTGLFGRILRR